MTSVTPGYSIRGQAQAECSHGLRHVWQRPGNTPTFVRHIRSAVCSACAYPMHAVLAALVARSVVSDNVAVKPRPTTDRADANPQQAPA